MKEKVIGILGGMGPEATLDCFGKIIRNAVARRDQDHLRVIVDSNPKVPDRTAAILGHGESPIPALMAGARVLDQAGADFIIIPCISAHFFLDELRNLVKLPILSMLDVVAEAIEKGYPEIRTVGLMATTGTLRGGVFQQRLKESNVETIVPEEEVQQKVMAAIYDIKDAQPSRSRAEISAELISVAETLISRGARAIIAGCTEIPLVLSQDHLSVPYFDPLLLLARAAIRRAGGKPKTPPYS
ncbi:MAG: amino acid racemase [Deltaproteobacteria bacterium]|nr:amino acid racemase [Deltaproteobacteria bacterium]